MKHSAEDYLQEANALLDAKSYSGASLALCRALDLNPHLVNAHYIVGALLLQAGQAAESLPCLMTANMLKPNNPQLIIAFSRALLEMGERDRAASNLAKAYEANPADNALGQAVAQCPVAGADAPVLDGFVSPVSEAEFNRLMTKAERALEQNKHKKVYQLASDLVWIAPQSAIVWKMLGQVAGVSGNVVQGEMCTRRAIAITPKDPEVWVNLARIVRAAPERQGDCERILRHASQVCGPDENIIATLCELYFGSNRYREAFALLNEAGGTLSHSVRLMRLKIEALQHSGQIEQATVLLEHALELEPSNHDLIADAFKFYEARVDPTPMVALLKTAKMAGVGLGTGVEADVMARVALRSGDLDEAHSHITRALSGTAEDAQKLSRRYTLANIEDKRGNCIPALDAARSANELMETLWELNGPCEHSMPIRRIDSLHHRLENEIASGVSRSDDPDAGPDNIAFLVGFPRSGTTLLDTILRSHSAVRILEEEPVVSRAFREAIPGMSGDETNFTEDWLDRLHAFDRNSLRETYLKFLSQFAEEDLAADKVYIDKLPLNMNWAPLLHELFPKAVFILARRHPLDVAVSNLFQDYQPNNAMLNMTSLPRINTFYDKSFALWEAFKNWRKPNIVPVAYEDLITDLEGSITPVMTALGLEWEEAQASYFETAQRRGRINTPSASQVTRKLYGTSRDRWRNYEHALQDEDSDALRRWAVQQGYQVENGD